MSIDRYMSFSRLRDFDTRGPRTLTEREEVKDGVAISIGSALDDFTNGDIKRPEENYEIIKTDRPTASLKKLCDYLYDNYEEVPSSDEIVGIVDQLELWSSTKDEKKKRNNWDIERFWDYIAYRFDTKGKKLLTLEDLNLVQEMRSILFTDETTSHLYKPEEGVDVHFQVAYETEYLDVKLKGYGDYLKINHNEKTIKGFDLKTGGHEATKFYRESFLANRLYLQACIYQMCIGKMAIEMGYTLEPFAFLYMSRKEKLPVLFNMTRKWDKAAFKGFTTITGYTYRGLDQLLEEIKFHYSHDIYDISKEMYDKGRNLELDNSLITVEV